MSFLSDLLLVELSRAEAIETLNQVHGEGDVKLIEDEI